MSQEKSRFSGLHLVGGALCLDFANTLIWRVTESPRELLKTYEDLVMWSQYLGILSGAHVKRLRQQAKAHPIAAREALRRALILREAIYQICSSLISNKRLNTKDLEEFNHFVAGAYSQTQIEITQQGFRWRWRAEEESLPGVLWPIARSMGELLTSSDWKRIGQCAGAGCGWLFLDKSRNRSRRWCDMSDCGHRTNARLSYRRRRARAKRS